MEASIDGGSLAPVTEPLTAPDTGDHWLAVASRDRAGLLSPIRWLRLRVDAMPPQVTLHTEPAPVEHDGRRWIPAASSAIARGEDTLAGLKHLFLAVDEDVDRAAAGELRATLPSEGTVRLRGWAIDQVGNRASESLLELAIDAVPPTGTIRVEGPQVESDVGTVLAPNSRLIAEPRDDASGLATWTARIDGLDAPTGALAGPWSAGPHRVEIVAQDRVGNSATLDPFRFVVDGDGPEIRWRVVSEGAQNDAGETYYLPPVEITAEASDAPAGLADLQSSADEESFSPLAGPISSTTDHVFLSATDRVGNRRQVRAAWLIDLEAPALQLETSAGERIEPGGSLSVQQGEVIRVHAVDAGAGIESSSYTIDERAWRFWRRTWWPGDRLPLPEALTLSRPGRIVLVVESFDRLGHRATASWTIDVHRASEGS